VLKNALEAAGPDAVTCALERRRDVAARGRGSRARHDGRRLARAGEPFFTTKNGDGLARGMGLGLFLARRRARAARRRARARLGVGAGRR
jgi:C4-dicarboxylate-specific signal transduction histidine kinase